MSYLDLLPEDIYNYILDIKHGLETKDLQAFADNFVMKVVSIKRVSTSKNGMWNQRTHHRYDAVIHLTYKPTQKSMITSYGYGAYDNEDSKPKKLYVIHGICFDAYFYKEGCWALYEDDNGNYQTNFSYAQYCESGEGSEMTYKQFIRWKVQVRKTELILGDAFDKFIMYSDQY